jgi:hypothetical protein
MKRNLRIFVRDRAAGYCEYCQLHEDYDSHVPPAKPEA